MALQETLFDNADMKPFWIYYFTNARCSVGQREFETKAWFIKLSCREKEGFFLKIYKLLFRPLLEYCKWHSPAQFRILVQPVQVHRFHMLFRFFIAHTWLFWIQDAQTLWATGPAPLLYCSMLHIANLLFNRLLTSCIEWHTIVGNIVRS